MNLVRLWLKQRKSRLIAIHWLIVAARQEKAGLRGISDDGTFWHVLEGDCFVVANYD